MNKTFTGKRQIGKTTQMLETVVRDFNPVNGERILCIGYKADHAEYLVKLLKGKMMKDNPYGITPESVDKIVEGVSIENYLANLDVYSYEFQYIILDETELILDKIFPTMNLYSTLLINKNIVKVENQFMGDAINKIYISTK